MTILALVRQESFRIRQKLLIGNSFANLSYLPGLISCDFHLFRGLKSDLGGYRFGSYKDVMKHVNSWSRIRQLSTLPIGLNNWQYAMKKRKLRRNTKLIARAFSQNRSSFCCAHYGCLEIKKCANVQSVPRNCTRGVRRWVQKKLNISVIHSSNLRKLWLVLKPQVLTHWLDSDSFFTVYLLYYSWREKNILTYLFEDPHKLKRLSVSSICSK